MARQEIVKTVCKLCPLSCFLDVHVKDGKITKVTGMKEFFHGKKLPCPRSNAIIEWVYSEDRLAKPLRKSNGSWQEVAWEDAYDFICERLSRIKEQYGPKGLALHLGNPFVGTQTEKVARRFCDVFGTPNYTSGSSFCFYSRIMGHSLTINYDRINALPNFKGCQCSIVWGENPAESNFIQLDLIRRMVEKGGKLIVIDPRNTSLAKEAHVYAQIKPGTDCALALGILNVIIEEGLYDQDFVNNWTIGFEKLVEHVKRYPLDKVEEITWVPAEIIQKIARTYAENRPANIVQGIAIDHSANGVQTSRLIAILMAITGNIDITGGNTWPSRIPFTDLRIPDKVTEEGIGAEYPIFNQFTLERTAMCIPDAILERKPYPVKGMIIQGSNPALVWPNANKVLKALKELDLLVVVDLFMTETAELAHVVLPSCSFLETIEFKDFRGGGRSRIIASKQAIKPIGDAKPDWQIWAGIGKRLGHAEYFPWQNTEQLIQELIEPTKIPIKKLLRTPGGILFAKPETKRYLNGGFNTPSGKVEIYSETLERLGYDAIPVYKEIEESSTGDSHTAKNYPLILVTGSRTKFYTHSRFRNITSLRNRFPEPLIEINPETAKARGISNGDIVVVESKRGRIKLKTAITEDVHPMVVAIQHGWSEANANLLTDDGARDPISAYAPFRTGLCQVTKI